MSKPRAWDLERRWRVIRVGVWVGIALLLATATALHPSIAERLLSSDGQLAVASKRWLVVIQIALLASASLLYLAGRGLRHHSPANERRVLGVVIAVCSVTGSLLLCEAGLRIASGFRPLPADRHFFFLHDDLLGWRHRPGAVALFKSAVVRINAAGLRDDELPPRAPTDEWRVLFLGDSQVFGDGVTAEDTFVDRLEQEVPLLQSINAGVIGYGTDQQVLYFEREGYRHQANATVVGLNAYDLRDNISARVRSGYLKPRFDLRDGPLRLTNVPIPKGSIVDRVQREIQSRSHLYTLIDHAFDGRGESASEEGAAQSARVFPPQRDLDGALDITVALLSRLAARVGSENGRLAVAFLPYEMDFAADRQYTAHVDRLVRTLEATGRGARFLVLDLRPHLRDATGLYRDTMHFSPEGHRRVASVLKRFLVENGLIRASHAN